MKTAALIYPLLQGGSICYHALPGRSLCFLSLTLARKGSLVMEKRALLVCVGVMFLVTCAYAAVSGQGLKKLLNQRREIRCPKLAQSPTIDGRLDESCWNKAGRTGHFFVLASFITASEQTAGLVFRDEKNLYIGVKCHDSDTLNIRAECTERDDGGVFADDCIEIFVVPDPERITDCYHFAVNARGTLYDSKSDDVAWNTRGSVAAHVSKPFWSLEIRLPLADFNVPVEEKTTWGFNIAREAPHYENPRHRDFSTWACLRKESFHQPRSFGRLVFAEPDKAYRLRTQAYWDAMAKYAAFAAREKLRADVWTLDYEGIDAEAMKKRLREHGWYQARGSWCENKEIFPSANRYNTLLVKTALAEKRLRDLEKMGFYLGKALPGKLRKEFDAVEQSLNSAYKAYGEVFEGFKSRGKVGDRRKFDRACDKLRLATADLDTLLDRTEQTMRAAAKKRGRWSLPPKLGRQPRSIPPLHPSGRMNRLVFGVHGQSPFPEVDVPAAENEFEFRTTRSMTPKTHTEDKVDFAYDKWWTELTAKAGYSTYAYLPFGVHYWTYCPYYFLENNRADPDILFHSWDGLLPSKLRTYRWREQDGRLILSGASRYTGQRGENVPLNHYHPKVREYLREYLPKVVNFAGHYPEILYYEIGAETNNYFVTDKGRRLTGYGPAATGLFRAYLKRKYGGIGKLNRAWRASYEAFDDIVQPRDPHTLGYDYRDKEVLTPLMAEFRAFRDDAFADHLRLIYETIKKADPTRPVNSYYGGPFWRYNNFRARWSETCDIFEVHGSSTRQQCANLYLASLQRCHKEKGLSYVETHWSYQEEKPRYAEERVQRRALEKDMYRTAVWGRTLQRRWTPHNFSVNEHYYWLHPRHDFTILRYAAPGQITSKRTVEKLDWVLTHSEIPASSILLVDPSSSVRNYGCYGDLLHRVHAFLYPRNYLYEFLPEEYIIDDKASLKNFDVVFLSYAKYLPGALAEKLIAWVHQGGTLIPIGPAGLYNKLGIRDGTLLASLLDMPWEEQAGQDNSRPCRRKNVGRGAVFYLPHILKLLDKATQNALIAKLDTATCRHAWSEGNRFEVLMRIDQTGAVYLSVLNPDPDEKITDTVVVPRRLETAVDVTVPGGGPITLEDFQDERGKASRFKLQLAPGEGAFVYCGTPAGE